MKYRRINVFILCPAKQKMADIIFIIKHLFYLKFFITFIIATKVYLIYTLILGHVVFRV